MIDRAQHQEVSQDVQEEKERLTSAVAAFMAEMDAMGLYVAAVTMNPKLQTEERTVFGYAGNISMESAEKFFDTFLKLRRDPESKTVLRQLARQQTDQVQ